MKKTIITIFLFIFLVLVSVNTMGIIGTSNGTGGAGVSYTAGSGIVIIGSEINATSINGSGGGNSNATLWDMFANLTAIMNNQTIYDMINAVSDNDTIGNSNETLWGMFANITNIMNNETINDTIDARTASVTYLPVNTSIEVGTWDDGNVDNMTVSKDGWSFNISELSGASPLTVWINFTGVEDITNIQLRTWYEDGSGHQLAIGLYDYTNNVYEEEYGDIEDQAEFETALIDVTDATDHILNGEASIRLRHIQNGIPSHNLRVDFAGLVNGFTTVVSHDHDAMGGRTNFDTNHFVYSEHFRLLNSTKANVTQIMNNKTILHVGEEQFMNISGGNFTGGVGIPTGWLGVGTNSPTRPLTVYGISLFSDNAASDITNIAPGDIELKNNNPTWWFTDKTEAVDERTFMILVNQGRMSYKARNDAGTLNLRDNILTMEHATGDVGMGTPNPEKKLEVNGNFNATDIQAGDSLIVGNGFPGGCTFSNDGIGRCDSFLAYEFNGTTYNMDSYSFNNSIVLNDPAGANVILNGTTNSNSYFNTGGGLYLNNDLVAKANTIMNNATISKVISNSTILRNGSSIETIDIFEIGGIVSWLSLDGSCVIDTYTSATNEDGTISCTANSAHTIDTSRDNASIALAVNNATIAHMLDLQTINNTIMNNATIDNMIGIIVKNTNNTIMNNETIAGALLNSSIIRNTTNVNYLNVGVGTATPISPIEVKGTVTITDSSDSNDMVNMTLDTNGDLTYRFSEASPVINYQSDNGNADISIWGSNNPILRWRTDTGGFVSPSMNVRDDFLDSLLINQGGSIAVTFSQSNAHFGSGLEAASRQVEIEDPVAAGYQIRLEYDDSNWMDLGANASGTGLMDSSFNMIKTEAWLGGGNNDNEATGFVKWGDGETYTNGDGICALYGDSCSTTFGIAGGGENSCSNSYSEYFLALCY